MADLKTHLSYSAVVSGVASSAFLSAGILSPVEAAMCWGLGVLGGVLPDVDSDNEKGAGIVFGVFSLLACTVAILSTIDQYPLIWAWAACALVFVIVQFGLKTLFVRHTSHRGVYHSLLGGLMFVMLTAVLSGLLGIESALCWFFAMFMGLGYLTHLLLDEAFKVNLMGEEYKKSFGGAIKLVDIKNLRATAFMAAACGVLFYFAPETAEFQQVAFSSDTYSDVVSVMF